MSRSQQCTAISHEQLCGKKAFGVKVDLLPEDSLHWTPAHAYDFHDYIINSGKLSGLLSLEQSLYAMAFPSLDLCLQVFYFCHFLSKFL